MEKTKSIKENYPTTNRIINYFRGYDSFFILKISHSYILKEYFSSFKKPISKIIEENYSDFDVKMIYEDVNFMAKEEIISAVGNLNKGKKVDLENLLSKIPRKKLFIPPQTRQLKTQGI